MKDVASDVHLFIGDTPTNCGGVNFTQIHKDYASKYKKSNFRIKRPFKRFKRKTGPFKSLENKTEPWKSQGNTNSTGWNLLFELQLKGKSNANVNDMTVEALWESSTHFKFYLLDDFKQYDKEIVMVTDKLKKRGKENRIFQQYSQRNHHNIRNDTGELFWYNHLAKDFLVNYAKNGLANELPPKLEVGNVTSRQVTACHVTVAKVA